jgi:hypothetical protein
MLFYYLSYIKYGYAGMLVVSLFVTACAMQAYSANSRRADDDPEKRDYRSGTLVVVFFTWPILLPALILVFIIRALLYSVFIIVFTIFLIILPREITQPTWLERKMTRIGDVLMEANTFLFKLLLRPWAAEPETA